MAAKNHYSGCISDPEVVATLANVRGFLIDFPLLFLKDENLSPQGDFIYLYYLSWAGFLFVYLVFVLNIFFFSSVGDAELIVPRITFV